MTEANALETALLQGEAGAFEFPGGSRHMLTVHASGTVGQEIICDGRAVQRVLRRGDVDLLPTGAPVRGSDDGPNEVLALAIPPQLVAAVGEDLGLRSISFRPLIGLNDPQMAAFAWSLHRRRRLGRWDLYDDCLAGEVVRRLLWSQAPRAEIAASRPEPLAGRRLRQVIDYIEAHLDQPISIEDLAIEAGLGPTAFKAAFRNTFAMPVHRHLVRRRAERARLLLLAGDLPASQVALEAGFTHQTHMARWLRRIFGMLPSDLIRQRA